MRLPRTIVPVLLVAVGFTSGAVAGCGDNSGDRASEPAPSTRPSTTTSTTEAPPAKEPAAAPATFVAVAKGSLPIYADTSGPRVDMLAGYTEFGTPLSLLVHSHREDKLWIEVGLQSRPNGSRAWVRRSDVRLQRVYTEIDVNLTTRRLELREHGKTIIETTVAIGADAYPTPLGITYVSDVIATGRPGGAYGPFAFALATHSETLTEFAGGDGQVAIHGTNDPGSIGRNVSHGCVRVPNMVAIALSTEVPVGTPVNVHT